MESEFSHSVRETSGDIDSELIERCIIIDSPSNFNKVDEIQRMKSIGEYIDKNYKSPD
jgi:hypothetical protein